MLASNTDIKNMKCKQFKCKRKPVVLPALRNAKDRVLRIKSFGTQRRVVRFTGDMRNYTLLTIAQLFVYM